MDTYFKIYHSSLCTCTILKDVQTLEAREASSIQRFIISEGLLNLWWFPKKILGRDFLKENLFCRVMGVQGSAKSRKR